MKKKTLLVAILSTVLISATLFSATPIGIIPVSAQCPELHLQVEAETRANDDACFAVGYFDPAVGYSHAECSSHWAYQGSGTSLVLWATSDVDVWQDAQGNVHGPLRGGALSVGASMLYFPPPVLPDLQAYAKCHYYSDGAPFDLACPRQSHILWITGDESRGYLIVTMGMKVEDETGIIYDVAIAVGGADGIKVIENVGVWPQGGWQVNRYPEPNGSREMIIATLAPYQFLMPVAGCGYATLYITMGYTPPLHGWGLSGIDAPKITSGESEVEDRYEATFNVPSVGGIVKSPDIEEPGAAIPDSSGHNFGAPAGIIAGAAVGVIMLISAAWYVRRRRTKAI